MTTSDSTLPSLCDIAIIGAGPSGAVLAGLLAKQGVNVVLLERDSFPRDKLCGEFLSYEARPILEKLGIASMLELKAAKIRSSRIFAQTGSFIQTDLPGEALGISRLCLDETLFNHAKSLGAHCFAKTDVRQIERSGWHTTLHVRHNGSASVLLPTITVGAWGRRTRLDRQLDREFIQERHPWVGMKQHHRPSSPFADNAIQAMIQDTVELHAFDGGYCGLNYVDDGVINVCALLTQDAFKSMGSNPSWRRLNEMMTQSCPSLSTRMQHLTPCDTATQSVAQVPFERKDLHQGSLFWLGDAAGMITPMTGDGQAMAIESADLLAPVLVELLVRLKRGSPQPDAFQDAAASWERRWSDHFQTRHRLGRLLQAMLIRPKVAEGVIRLGAMFPKIPQTLTKATRGSI